MTTALAPEAVATAAGWSAEVASVRLEFGAGCLARIGEHARALGGSRALIVTDPGVRAAGHPARAAEALIAADLAVEIFDRVAENPTTAHVEEGAEAAREERADLLIAIGGGSALDVAKGINFLVTNGGRMEDYWGFGRAREPLLPAIGVPTTAGTGSDAQSYALIAQSQPAPRMRHGRKMACGDRKARFAAVLLDPELLASAPRAVMATAGMDALSHAVESFVTKRRTPVSALWARAAWERLEPAFERALAAPADLAARGAMLVGAHFAGAAIEASMLGAAHAAANPLTAAYGTTHGIAVGLMLPHVVRWNAGEAESDALYRGLLPGGGAALAARLEALRTCAGLPARLQDCGIERLRLEELAELATKEWTGTFNPRPMTQADFLRLYEAAY